MPHRSRFWVRFLSIWGFEIQELEDGFWLLGKMELMEAASSFRVISRGDGFQHMRCFEQSELRDVLFPDDSSDYSDALLHSRTVATP